MKTFLATTPEVGQRVFVRVLCRVNRVNEAFAEEVTVESVGRKYFTLKGDRFGKIRFLNEGKIEQTNFVSLIKIYPNKKEYQDEKLRHKARFDIENAVKYRGLDFIDIEDIKTICKLLNTTTFEE